MEQSVRYEIHEWCTVGKTKLGQKLKVPTTKISSAELVRNSKSEEQEIIIKYDGT
jgi:hypothetical protein